MEGRTWFWVALAVGAVIVLVLLRRGASGSQISTLAPLPSGDSGDRAQAFSSLIDLGRTEIEANRDLSLGRIQSELESYRIAAAERAAREEARAQIAMAQMQADAQQSSSFFDFLGGVASVALPLVL